MTSPLATDEPLREYTRTLRPSSPPRAPALARFSLFLNPNQGPWRPATYACMFVSCAPPPAEGFDVRTLEDAALGGLEPCPEAVTWFPLTGATPLRVAVEVRRSGEESVLVTAARLQAALERETGAPVVWTNPPPHNLDW
ncbi:hypothetical protein Q5752_002758 [Cryptotrichosporon argae]